MSAPEWRRFEPFRALSQGELARLTELLEERALAPGELLWREGSEADGAILLADGALACARERLGELGRIEAPAVLGLASLAASGRRELSLEAAEQSRVLVLTRAAFQRFAQEAPPAALRVLEGVVRDLGGLLRGGIGGLSAPRG